MNNGKSKFRRATEQETVQSIAQSNLQIQKFKNHWHQMCYNPILYAILGILIAILVLFGYYWDWNIKIMIDKSFGYILTIVLEFFIIKHFEKQQIHLNTPIKAPMFQNS
jgi:hypothetical protein